MTAWGMRRSYDIKIPGWARFIIAFALILLGPLALTSKGSLHRMVKPHCARSDN
jgi:hypothetical protein